MLNWFAKPVSEYGRRPWLLEVVCRPARIKADRRPLLFIHGACAGAWCWDEHFLTHFAGLGYDSYALSLRGHGQSDGHGQLHFHGIDDYVDDVRQVVESLPVEPILIGHSMGGMVIQKYLESYQAPGAILMAPVPPGGLGASMFELVTSDPWLFSQVSLINGGGLVMVDVESAGRALFSGDLDGRLLQRYARRMQAESHRALIDMTITNLPYRWRMSVPPMLVIGADNDVLFSPARIRRTAQGYQAQLVMLPDMAHALMLEKHWKRAADAMQAWLGSMHSV